MNNNNLNQKSNFESLLDLFPITDPPQPRSLVTGTVVKKTDKGYYVDINMKSESFICERDNNSNSISVGCTYQFMVMGPADQYGAIPLSRKEAYIWHELDTMRQLETVCFVTVKSISMSRSGHPCGLNTSINGIKAFIPRGEIPNRQKLTEFLNQEIAVCILETDIKQVPDGVVILSHKKALEFIFLQQVESYSPSATLRCLVVSVMSAGVLVRIVSSGSNEPNGLLGFVPKSELTYDRKPDPFAIVERGDLFDAQILTIDMESQNIVLSRRRAIQSQFLFAISAGQKLKGRISRMTDYAFYVEVGNCLDAVLYKRDLNKSDLNSKSGLKLGDHIDATVLCVKPKEQKLVLSRKQN